MDERNSVILETVRDMIARGEVARAVRTISDLHSADASEILASLDPSDETLMLVKMEPGAAARALLEMEESHQVEVASRLKAGRLRELLERMPVDEAVDLLGDIPDADRRSLLKLFGASEARELESLLVYGDDTAGGLMTPDFISVSPEDSAQEVINFLRSVSPDVETIYYVYVLSGERLVGVLSLRQLILSPPERRVGDIMQKEVISVAPNDDQEKVAEVISRYDLLAVPVTSESGRMLGIVTVDDVMEVIEDEAQEDILRFAGATGSEQEPREGLFAGMGRRLPWFAVAVVVEVLIAGGILKLYSPLFEEFMVLVFFIPLLVTMGGNIAVQSSAVIGRWLATGTPTRSSALRAISGEVLWGVMVGLLTGAVVAAISLAFNQKPSVGAVVGLSLALTVVAASLVGCALPVTLKALKRDPASVSGPLLGTTMDVVSLAIYFGIGMLLI